MSRQAMTEEVRSKVSDDLKRKFRELAKRDGFSVAAHVRKACINYVNAYEKEAGEEL